jgi:oligoendopeptidase F
MRLLLLSALALALATGCSRDPAAVARRLDEKESRLERLYADYWRAEYRIAQGDKTASSRPIQAQIRALVTEDAFLRDLEAVRFPDPLRQRRRKLFLDEAAHTRIFTDPGLSRLVESMDHDENDIRYDVGGTKLTRSALNNLIASEPDRARRELAWRARAANYAVTGERIRQAMRLRKGLGRRFAHREYVDFMLDRKGVPERPRLERIFAEYQRATREEYGRLLARIRRDLKVSVVEPWDLEYYFSTLSGSFERAKFPRDQAWPRIRQTAAALGLDLASLPLDVRIAEITFGGGTYPIRYGKEARILVNRYEGIRFTDTLFHESGHGLHYLLMKDPTFILQSSSSEPFDEGCGQIMALMLYRRPVATRVFGLSAAEHAALLERYRLKTIVDTLETIVDATFEYRAYDDPGQDLTALYNRIYQEVMGIDLHGLPVWAFNPFYSTGPIYLQSYAVAEMAARQIHADLDRRFGPVWDQRAGEYLRRHYFSIGGRLTLDQILQQGTGEPLEPKYLIEWSNGRPAALAGADRTTGAVPPPRTE